MGPGEIQHGRNDPAGVTAEFSHVKKGRLRGAVAECLAQQLRLWRGHADRNGFAAGQSLPDVIGYQGTAFCAT
jgi:hypothetical protein